MHYSFKYEKLTGRNIFVLQNTHITTEKYERLQLPATII